MNTISFKSIKHEQGAVLVISLLFLLVTTIIGVASMQSTSLEEKMTGNMRDNDMAFQAAEAALRGAEKWLETVNNTGTFNGSGGLYSIEDENDHLDVSASSAVWGSAIEYDTSNTLLNQQPQYIVQYVGIIPGPGGDKGTAVYKKGLRYGSDVSGFEVTARGVGQSGSAVVILRTLYGRRL